jgi:hypothetical protein
MKPLYLTLLLVFFISSCVTEKRCQSKFPPQENTVIKYIDREVVKWKDTIIYKDLPPVIIERWVSVKDTLELIGAYSSALSWVSGNTLQGTLKEGLKPVKIEYKIKEVEVEKIRTEYKEKIVQVKYVPKFYKILSIIGAASVIILAVWLYLKFT